MPPTAPVQFVETQAAAVAIEENVAPHNYDHIFIIEKLDHFVEDPFDGDVATLPIPPEVINQASMLVNELRDAAVKVNKLIADKTEIDE